MWEIISYQYQSGPNLVPLFIFDLEILSGILSGIFRLHYLSNFEPTLANKIYAIGQIFIVAYSQILNNNLATLVQCIYKKCQLSGCILKTCIQLAGVNVHEHWWPYQGGIVALKSCPVSIEQHFFRILPRSKCSIDPNLIIIFFIWLSSFSHDYHNFQTYVYRL